jgi:hypothetical protein
LGIRKETLKPSWKADFGFFYARRGGDMFDVKAWRKKLGAILREHPDITADTTGQVELNLNRGAVSKAYKLETETKDGGAVKVTTKTELK